MTPPRWLDEHGKLMATRPCYRCGTKDAPRRPLIVGRDRFPERPPSWRDWLGLAIALGMVFGFVVLAARWTSWP